jgi:hypothetical protein
VLSSTFREPKGMRPCSTASMVSIEGRSHLLTFELPGWMLVPLTAQHTEKRCGSVPNANLARYSHSSAHSPDSVEGAPLCAPWQPARWRAWKLLVLETSLVATGGGGVAASQKGNVLVWVHVVASSVAKTRSRVRAVVGGAGRACSSALCPDGTESAPMESQGYPGFCDRSGPAHELVVCLWVTVRKERGGLVRVHVVYARLPLCSGAANRLQQVL